MNNRNFSKATEAVSPVVATLLLVLVAAGAAIGFGVFLNGFQKDAQDNVSTDVSNQCLSIAGSSTVFEFTAIAEPLFENSDGGCDIVNNAGGSGAGLQSIGIGAVDIGAMSHDPTTSDLAKYPDLNKDGKKDFGVPDLTVTRVGFDAVVSVFSSNAATDLCAKDKRLTTELTRDIWFRNGGISTDKDGGAVTQITAIAAGADNKFSWAEIFPNDADCAAYTDPIQLVSRSDKGGTVDVFCDKLVGMSHVDLCKAPITASAVWTKGFGSSGANTGSPLLGNQDAEALMGSSNCISATTFCLGYTSMAGDDTNSAIRAFTLDINNDGDDADNAATTEGVKATSTTVRDNTYGGWRSLVYLTIGSPSGVAKQYLDFVMLPKNNQEIAAASGFISLYP